MADQKISEQERQQWLDAVHESSSCQMSFDDPDENKVAVENMKKDKQQIKNNCEVKEDKQEDKDGDKDCE